MRPVRVLMLVSTLAAIALASGLSFASADPAASPAPAASGPYIVHMKNFAFTPASLAVPVGATVSFKNDDSAAHTVTLRGTNGFDSGNMDQGAEFKYVFSKAGKYDYICQYHANMKGSIIVGGPAVSPTPYVPPSPSGGYGY